MKYQQIPPAVRQLFNDIFDKKSNIWLRDNAAATLETINNKINWSLSNYSKYDKEWFLERETTLRPVPVSIEQKIAALFDTNTNKQELVEYLIYIRNNISGVLKTFHANRNRLTTKEERYKKKKAMHS